MFFHAKKYLMIFIFILNTYGVAADFTFPENSWIYFSQDRSLDVSGLALDLRHILIGGLGYGADASLLLAQGMKAVGSTGDIYNAPFCVYRRKLSTNDGYILLNDRVDRAEEVANIGGFNRTITTINLPLDIDGHASLASIKLENSIVIAIMFYDSLAHDGETYKNFYAERYEENLIRALMKFVANDEAPVPPHSVVHALYQGSDESNGCGYYTIFTAMLLKRNPELHLEENKPLYGKEHDHLIRASVALVSFMNDDISQSKSLVFDERIQKTKIHHKLQAPDATIAEKILPRWYKIFGNETNADLWVKYNDSIRMKWSNLLAASILYQEALKLPPDCYKIRAAISTMIMDLATIIIGKEIFAKFSRERLESFRDWLDEQGYAYDPKLHLFGQEEILKKELLIFD